MVLPLPRIAVSLVVSACAWPLSVHLPEEEEAVLGSEDPRALVTATWATDAGSDQEQPPGRALGALAVGRGVATIGALQGIGWTEDAEPERLFGDDCGSDGVRVPVSPGDWRGDVDVSVVTVTDPGTLCVDLRTDAPDVGLDAIGWQLDACGVPTSLLVSDDGGPLGWNVRGPDVAWRTTVDAGNRVSVVVAAFAPNARSREVRWQLGVSLIEDGPCPYPPEWP